MSYAFESKRQYLMPTHFGPMSGPRHTPSGGRFPDPDDRIKESFTVSFLSDAKAVSTLLPEGFDLDGEPVVSVAFSYMTNIAWLAGRGYNMLGVTVPARLKVRERTIVAPFLLVLWENLADPIITGREQLGFNKIYCELPERSSAGGETTCRAAWLGHQFCSLQARELVPQPEGRKAGARSQGEERASLLHLRYFPSIGRFTEAAICEAAVSPLNSASGTIETILVGEGEIVFHPTRWEDMPTQFHIVEALRGLPVRQWRGAEYRRIRGGTDHFAQEAVPLTGRGVEEVTRFERVGANRLQAR